MATEHAATGPQADALLVAIGRGDPQALREVYRRHHEVVRAFARRLLGSDADAEEIVHDVFVDLRRAVLRFGENHVLSTFVMAVSVVHARRFLLASRRVGKRPRRPSSPATSSASASPEHAAREQLAQNLLQALSQLSDEQRLAFVLCEVEQRNSAAAAQILGIPASTLRSRLSAARDTLRHLLSDEALS